MQIFSHPGLINHQTGLKLTLYQGKVLIFSEKLSKSHGASNLNVFSIIIMFNFNESIKSKCSHLKYIQSGVKIFKTTLDFGNL